MPELPEVETVRAILEKRVVGKTVRDVLIRYEKIIKNTSSEEFAARLKGAKLTDISRRGKYLLLSSTKQFCFRICGWKEVFARRR